MLFLSSSDGISKEWHEVGDRVELFDRTCQGCYLCVHTI